MNGETAGSERPPRKAHHYAPHLIALVGALVAIYLAMRPAQPPEPPHKDPPPAIESRDSEPDQSEPDQSEPDKSEPDKSEPGKSKPGGANSAAEEASTSAAAGKLLVENVTVRDRDGDVIWRGTVDLRPTAARIDAGERLEKFSHDGIVFQNRERRLPVKARGYYHEYVHPTPGVSGPGPQRVVAGGQRELYYTADHYETFRQVR
jgi:filamentous hemagglutinin